MFRINICERKPKDAIVSFGDLPHHRPEDVRDQTERMKGAFPKVARLRMFGASSVDFSYLAAGKTEGVVLFTKNKWDIAPGLLLAKEAGAYLSDPDFHSYSFQCRGIVAANSEELCKILTLQGDSYDSSQ